MNIFTSSKGFVKVDHSVQKALIKGWTVDNDAPLKRQTFTGK